MPTQLLTATGSATVYVSPAQIIARRRTELTAFGSAFATGQAATARVLPSGGLTDFGLWGAGQPDTAMTRDMSHATATDTSTPSRGWLAATAPTAYTPGGVPLWNKAAYAGIGVKWTAMAAGEQHEFSNVQLEAADIGNRLSWDASSWESRRCYVGAAAVTYATVAQSSDTAISGTHSGKITYTGATSGVWGYFINPTTPLGLAPCTPGEFLNGAVSVSMQRAAWWSVAMRFYDATYTQVGTSFYTGTYRQHPGSGAWDTSNIFGVNVPAGAVWVSVVPRISINSTVTATDAIAPVGEVAYCDMHRIWSRPYQLKSTPTAYTAPRKLSIAVKANRVNLINNPNFTTDTFGWGVYGTGTAPTPYARDVTKGRTTPGALKFTLPTDISSYGVGTITGPALLTAWSTSNFGGFGWKTNTTYTSSVYVKLGPGCPPVTLNPGGYTATAGVLNTNDALNHPELIEGEWIRLWARFTTSSTDDGLVGLSLAVKSADVTAGGAGALFWIDDVLNEETDQLRDYFDGDSAGSDYLWAGTPQRSSSHYYRGFRSNAYRLNDIVKSAVPHGTQFELLYAQPPQ